MSQIDISGVNYTYTYASSMPSGGYVYVCGAIGSTGGGGVYSSGIYDSNGAIVNQNFRDLNSNGMTVLTDGRIVVGAMNTMSGMVTSTVGTIYSSTGQFIQSFSVPRNAPTNYVDTYYESTPDGGFLVAYNNSSQYSLNGINVEKYDSNISKINTFTLEPESALRPVGTKIAVNSNGYIAFVYTDDTHKVKWALTDADGNLIQKKDMQVPSGANGDMYDLTWINESDFIVTFNDPQSQGQYAQIINESGEYNGDVIKINESALVNGGVSGAISPPSITRLSEGDAVISWQTINPDSSTDIHLRTLRSDGALGKEYVAIPVVANQVESHLVGLNNSNFAMIWVDTATSNATLNSVIAKNTSLGYEVLHANEDSNVSILSLDSIINGSISPDCFAEGAEIKTDKGYKKIEEIKLTDYIQSNDGRFYKINWIPKRKVIGKLMKKLDAYPVLIRASALGRGLPSKDLRVSKCHGILLNNHLINAEVMVNGVSILLDKDVESLIYYHLELDSHQLVNAAGLIVETYCNKKPRILFDNYSEYLFVNGNEKIIPELSMPRVNSRRQLARELKIHLENLLTEYMQLSCIH